MNFSLPKKLGMASLLGLSIAAASQAQAASCVYSVSNEWNTGFQGSITITNDGTTAINGWNVGWTYANNKITSSWNATLTGSNPYSAASLDWNKTIQPGQSVSFGVQGDKNGTTAEKPVITGNVCSTSVSSSSASSSVAANRPPVAVIASPTGGTQISGSPIVYFSAVGSSDPDGDALTYEWNVNGTTLTGISPTYTITTSGISATVTYTLTVRDGRGGEATKSGSLWVSLEQHQSSSSRTSSSSSAPSTSSSSLSSSSPSSAACASQCNWYGTTYLSCTTTTNGWGYENGKSCIAPSTCTTQPAPYGLVGASCPVSSSSSSVKSSSSVATSSSVKSSSSVAVSSSSIKSSSSSSVGVSSSSVKSSSSSVGVSSSSVKSSSSSVVVSSSSVKSSSSIGVSSSSIKSSSSSVVVSSSSVKSSSSAASSTGLANCAEPTIPVGAGQAKSGYVVYEPVAKGKNVDEYNRPYVVSCDGTKYSLPYPHIFDYGTDQSIVLDDFADNDHQNNLGGALATYRGENYTEGGGYWYTFADKTGTTLKNATGLAINAYNVGKAISGHELNIKMNVTNPGYAGVGTNILFEEAGVDLADLAYVQVTAYGSGTIGVMFETTDINKPTEWGNYATKVPLTLTATPTVYKYTVADFEGEKYSGLAGLPLAPHLGVASKFFFQAKDGAVVDIHVKKIEFFFNAKTSPSRLAQFKWKTGVLAPNPGFVFDATTIGVPPALDATDPYINFATAAIAPLKTQSVAVTKTAAQLASTGKPNWLHVEGTKLFDTQGHLVRMTGVNWFGFETKNQVPFGLWTRSYKSMLAQIKTLGFNTVRIPYSDYMLDASRDGSLTLGTLNIDLALNGLTATQTPLDLLDAIIAEAKTLGLKVILDSHSRLPDSYLSEGLWNPSYYPEAKWIANWKFIAARYATNDAVAAFDLKNEPHFTASWGSTDSALNWNEAAQRAANAIQTVNANALIVVEGVEGLNASSKALNKYWWGGNMQGVLTNPINITFNNKLVYSPHEYGPEVYTQPWFRDYRFPLNLRYIWEDRFGFIYNQGIGHTLIGEFGIKDNVTGSASNKWFEEFVKYMGDHSEGYSWTYWAWNPNSGDTGGILTDDWNGINDWKLAYIKPYMAPLIGNQNGL